MIQIGILITGEAHSGKDTSGDYLAKKLRNVGYRVAKIGLADQLKIVCQHLIKLFHGIEIPLKDFYDLQQKEMERHDLPLFDGRPFKLRTIMQLVGTEVFRDRLWNGIWCDFVRKNYIENPLYDVIIITDCRYHDEHLFFKKLETSGQINHLISFRVSRNNKEQIASFNQTHKSEIDINHIGVDHVINNDQSLDSLYNFLDEVIIKWCFQWK